MQSSVDHWEGLLWAMGSTLVPNKCFWYWIDFKQTNKIGHMSLRTTNQGAYDQRWYTTMSGNPQTGSPQSSAYFGGVLGPRWKLGDRMSVFTFHCSGLASLHGCTLPQPYRCYNQFKKCGDTKTHVTAAYDNFNLPTVQLYYGTYPPTRPIQSRSDLDLSVGPSSWPSSIQGVRHTTPVHRAVIGPCAHCPMVWTTQGGPNRISTSCYGRGYVTRSGV